MICSRISQHICIRIHPSEVETRQQSSSEMIVRSFVCDLMTTVLYINVQFEQPVCCCLVQCKKVTIALCVGAEGYNMFCRLLGFTTAACCIFASPIFCIMCPKLNKSSFVPEFRIVFIFAYIRLKWKRANNRRLK